MSTGRTLPGVPRRRSPSSGSRPVRKRRSEHPVPFRASRRSAARAAYPMTVRLSREGKCRRRAHPRPQGGPGQLVIREGSCAARCPTSRLLAHARARAVPCEPEDASESGCHSQADARPPSRRSGDPTSSRPWSTRLGKPNALEAWSLPLPPFRAHLAETHRATRDSSGGLASRRRSQLSYHGPGPIRPSGVRGTATRTAWLRRPAPATRAAS